MLGVLQQPQEPLVWLSSVHLLLVPSSVDACSFYGTDIEYHRYEAKREAARTAAAAGKAAAEALDTDEHPDATGAAVSTSEAGAAAAAKKHD